MMEQMEIMQLPSKNQVRFSKEILPWVDRPKSYQAEDDTLKLVFKSDTPFEVKQLFEDIKEELAIFS